MKLNFPYQSKFSPFFGDIPTIKLLLNIETPQGLVPFIFLFDTGADVTSFPASASEILGVDLDECPKELMTGYEGIEVDVYRSEVTVNLNKKTFRLPCVFNPKENVPIILGRAGILNCFNVFLDGKKKWAIFEQL